MKDLFDPFVQQELSHSPLQSVEHLSLPAFPLDTSLMDDEPVSNVTPSHSLQDKDLCCSTPGERPLALSVRTPSPSPPGNKWWLKASSD